MKKEERLALAGILSLVLIGAVCAVPVTTHNSISTTPAILNQDVPQTQSASGTISAVDKASFTLTLTPSHNVNVGSVAQQDPPKSMTFVIDKNTAIEGKLAVGSNAQVTYRDDAGGNHLAIAVQVTPSQN